MFPPSAIACTERRSKKSLESFTLKNRSLSAWTQRALTAAAVVALSVATLALSSCGQNIYAHPEFTFAGRPIPPSQLQERVLVGVTINGSTGTLQILDGLRDIRNNVQNTIASFSISGFSGGYPNLILNFPEQLRGYVYSNVSPFGVSVVNYSTEAASGSGGSFSGQSTSLATASDFRRVYSAEESLGVVAVQDNQIGAVFNLNLPNVFRVATNQGDTVALAMVRNSNSIYRIIKLNNGGVSPPGAVDCEPTVLPVYCVVPVPGTFDRPQNAYFATDGSSAYILNCGVECGGGSTGGASVSILPQGNLTVDLIPTATPYPPVVTNTVPVPGGATTAISDGTTLYVAGQALQPDGLFEGFLTPITLANLAVGTATPISDGNHSKLLFADDNTLWVGSQNCANGERAKQGLNYNCLTAFNTSTKTATIVPANIIPGSTTVANQLPYPNQDNNLYYYGSLTGICWVQTFHKVYTAYGGQIHAFNTATLTEINNTNITVQGTALDVAYMDAATNTAN